MHAAERQTVEQLQNLLVGELHHRIKNILATVMAITSQSLRSAETTEAGRELSAKVGDGPNREGGISWGCLTPPLLHSRSDMPCPTITLSNCSARSLRG